MNEERTGKCLQQLIISACMF